MVQVIIFFIAFGILVANGAGVIGAFLGGVVISFIGSFLLLGLFAALSEK
ncbi:MAG: hypothetical protein JW384_01470 [Nitrosomonadaceae bacterium]|nr:hypothetical protein [Nitrosomonadaceae bacterium]